MVGFAGLVNGTGFRKFTGSFQAMGQAYMMPSCSENPTETSEIIFFKESYFQDLDTGQKKASLVIDMGQFQKITLLEDISLNESFIITNKECSRTSIGGAGMIQLELMKDGDGSFAFPIRQMLSLDEPNSRPTKGTCRGQPCITWNFEPLSTTKKYAEGKSVVTTSHVGVVFTDFSDANSWKSMSKERNVPLRLSLCHRKQTLFNGIATEEEEKYEVMDIMYFTHDAVIMEDLEYADGVYCDGFVSKYRQPDISNLMYLSYSAEVAFQRGTNRTVAETTVGFLQIFITLYLSFSYFSGDASESVAEKLPGDAR